MSSLPAISLWQPWASLLFVKDGKVHETRHWPAPEKYLDRTVLIHAAKKVMHPQNLDDCFLEICRRSLGLDWRDTVPRGAFVGVATLSTSIRIGPQWTGDSRADWLCGDWTWGRYAWRLENRRPLRKPIPAIGRQGFWYPDELPDDPSMLDLLERIDACHI